MNPFLRAVIARREEMHNEVRNATRGADLPRDYGVTGSKLNSRARANEGREMLRRGVPVKEIARQLNTTPNRVRNWRFTMEAESNG